MPQQTSASDFTTYKKINSQVASAQYSTKPNVHLANPVLPSLKGTTNVFLLTQANAIPKHYTGNGKPQVWHR